MRGKRSKVYRKLIQQYGLAFGFREPYQVILDAGMLEDAVARFKMDFVNILGRTLHGQVKPMLTECTIRHLYKLPTGPTAQPSDPNGKTALSKADKDAIINVARTCEKRRCGHHDLEEPLSTLECLKSVVDPKSSSTNKHRYVLACQDESVRSWARTVRGIPSIYVRRSVMIMEPMAEISVGFKNSAERDKLRSGVKRKRGEPRDEFKSEDGQDAAPADRNATEKAVEKKKKKATKGPRAPNPLSMKKPKTRNESNGKARPPAAENDEDAAAKKKRKRRHHGPNESESTQFAAED